MYGIDLIQIISVSGLIALGGVIWKIYTYIMSFTKNLDKRFSSIDDELKKNELFNNETNIQLKKLEIMDLMNANKSPAIIDPIFNRYINLGGNSHVIESYITYKENFHLNKDDF